MSRVKNFSVGYFSIFLCCFATAVSLVFISHMNKTHNIMLSIFMTFAYATVIFNGINFKNIKSLYSLVFCNKKILLRMNVVTLFNWLSTFMALRYLDPATALCFILGIVSITMFIVSVPINQLKSNKHLFYSVFLIAISLGLIAWQHIALHQGEENLHNLFRGFLWCLLGGIMAAFIGRSSEAMGNAGFSVTQILATRFYFLTFFGGIAFIFMHHGAIAIDWKYYLLSALLIVFFPLLMYQIAIRELGTLLVSLLEPFSPVLAYILQVMIGDYRFNIAMIGTLLFCCLTVAWFARIEQGIQIKKQNNLAFAKKV